MNQENFNKAIEKIKKINQEHILAFLDDISEEKKEELINQINTTNLEEVLSLYQDLVVKGISIEKDDIKSIESENVDDMSNEEKNRLIDLGLKTIKNGEVAAFLVAGGQGSRLGFNGPKGAYSVGLSSGKSLFQLQAERLINLREKTGVSIPWYIMTSPQNNDYTVRFFKEHDFFGFGEDNVKFFPQDQIPSVDENGKIIMADKSEISLNPNGSGGCFTALKDSGLLKDMVDRGIKYVFFYGVDNILVKMADPLLIGYAVEKNKDITSKSVVKISPEERVGVYAYRNGKPSIIEYTELPEDMATLRDEKGNLLYRSANINAQVFKMSFLEEALKHAPVYHVAHKKIKYLDKAGNIVSPEKENAYKFESFFFDYFEYADDMAILDVKREEEFAPVKNLEGKDSKDSAREMIHDLHKNWLMNIGIEEKDIPSDIEISPLISFSGENLNKEEVLKRLKNGESYIG